MPLWDKRREKKVNEVDLPESDTSDSNVASPQISQGSLDQ